MNSLGCTAARCNGRLRNDFPTAVWQLQEVGVAVFLRRHLLLGTRARRHTSSEKVQDGMTTVGLGHLQQ